MFKTLITTAAAVAVLATAGAAAAGQPWQGDNGYQRGGNDRGYDDGNRYGDGDYRNGNGYGDSNHRHWGQGQRGYRGERIDYRAYHMRRPPYGYEYRRNYNGDIVLAAVIASVLLNQR